MALPNNHQFIQNDDESTNNTNNIEFENVLKQSRDEYDMKEMEDIAQAMNISLQSEIDQEISDENILQNIIEHSKTYNNITNDTTNDDDNMNIAIQLSLEEFKLSQIKKQNTPIELEHEKMRIARLQKFNKNN